jgi:hypothetical protein
MRKKSDTRSLAPNTGAEEVPPGATTRADHRKRNPGGGAPGSAAGPRHAAGDEGSPAEEYDATDSNEPLADPTLEEEGTPDEGLPAYGGPSAEQWAAPRPRDAPWEGIPPTASLPTAAGPWTAR